MKVAARTLARILRYDEDVDAVRKAELRRGDQIVVATENSVYSIAVESDSVYRVRGGWFDSNGGGPSRTSINGCTWGGSVIQTRIVAARGLRLEFSNRVVTSPIREFWLFRAEEAESDETPLTAEDAALLADSGMSWPGSASAPASEPVPLPLRRTP